ncbi:hypothetical protein EVAR_79082_1 [Eumeta japonica]|uniref:Uncharacterized protein n=1 Tax=Eumeta variegata TaxID=151549 RepID=A0A4C1WZH0_EUMVA|nr:hypothetical protein EVAR_79082_1 [Eumeta japonica]
MYNFIAVEPYRGQISCSTKMGRYHILPGYAREVAASAVAFHPASESSDASPCPYQFDRTPLDNLFPPKRPATHWWRRPSTPKACLLVCPSNVLHIKKYVYPN